MTTEPHALIRSGSTLAPAAHQEWILADGLGGYSMGTVLGLNSRRYHGLLVAALRPPVDRVMALSALDDALHPSGADPVRLTLFHFDGQDDRPAQHEHLERFELESDTARWTFRVPTRSGPATVVRTLRRAHGRAAVEVRYETDHPEPMGLEIRPLVALRDFHELLAAPDSIPNPKPGGRTRLTELPGSGFTQRPIQGGVLLARGPAGVALGVEGAEASEWQDEPMWWHGLHYAGESARGFADTEDLLCPGVFALTLRAGDPVVLRASADAELGPFETDRTERCAPMVRAATTGVPETDAGALARLARAADAFVVRRVGEDLDGQPGVSIIAGYPWFADWGRDTMIALPGVLLETGRFEEAKSVLKTFAHHRRDGIIPNRFDDHAGEAHYNTVDASLWFVHACDAYVRATGDESAWAELEPACLDIERAYCDGTMNGIGMDPADALIRAGDADTQLTWMDAQRDGVTFTPRHGKPVEINALWHHALRILAARVPARAKEFTELADRAADSMRTKFWSEVTGCLVDTLTPDEDGTERPSLTIRPNMLFAVSLDPSPLTPEQQRGVVAVARERLLTPMGMRTLAPEDPAFRPRFEGSIFELDAAYHQGTVWPWLIGPYAEALLRANSFSASSRAETLGVLRPLLDQLDPTGPGALGQLFEVYDGYRDPQRPGGCMAQAWSVAETLRVLRLAHRNAG